MGSNPSPLLLLASLLLLPDWWSPLVMLRGVRVILLVMVSSVGWLWAEPESLVSPPTDALVVPPKKRASS
jgi:hypothetical protein